MAVIYLASISVYGIQTCLNLPVPAKLVEVQVYIPSSSWVAKNTCKLLFWAVNASVASMSDTLPFHQAKVGWGKPWLMQERVRFSPLLKGSTAGITETSGSDWTVTCTSLDCRPPAWNTQALVINIKFDTTHMIIVRQKNINYYRQLSPFCTDLYRYTIDLLAPLGPKPCRIN